MGELVVGVDGSAGSRAALAWAVDAARVRGDDLAVVTVTSPPAVLWPSEGGPGDEELERVVVGRADAMLDEMLAPYGDAGVTMTIARLEGVPYEALIDRADRTNGLIVGSRGNSMYRRLLLGSVSQQVVVHARAPVTVVPSPEEEGRRHDAVIVGVDGSQGARRALLRAAEEARLRHWKLEVVGVQPPPPLGGERIPAEAAMYIYMSMGMPPPKGMEIDGDVARQREQLIAHWRNQIEGQLNREIERIDQDFLPEKVTCDVIGASSPVRALLDKAAWAKLLVVGSRGRGGFTGMLLGSVSQHCVRHATAPVMVVPSE